MNQEMNSNKKNIIFTIILLLMLVPAIVGYTLAILNFLSRDIKEKDVDIVNEVEELELNSPLVTELYQKTSINTNEQSQRLIVNNIDYNEINSIPDELKLTYAYNSIKQVDIVTTEDVKTVSLDALEKSMKNLFGDDITFEKVDFTPITCNEKFTYDTLKEAYVSSINECTKDDTQVESVLIKASKEGKKIILEEKFYYLNDSKYYQDKPLTTLISDVEITNVSDYYDKMSTAIYTFMIDENGQYHLSQFKINK